LGGGGNVHIGTGADIRSTKTQSENHCMHFNSAVQYIGSLDLLTGL
jgi:hypothetical protein